MACRGVRPQQQPCLNSFSKVMDCSSSPPADVVLGSSSGGASAPLALSRRPMQLLLDRFLYTDGSVQGLWRAMDLAGARVHLVGPVGQMAACLGL